MKKKPVFLFVVFFLIALGILLVYRIVFFQTLKFDPIQGPIVNPLMGLAPWATIEESQQPHTLVYADLTWRDFEPREGDFDFAAFEERNQFARWREEGKRVVFRFILDMPGEESHLDIPEWLYEKIKGQGDFYNNEYGQGFSPDYSNPILIAYHQKAIKALGDRYGSDGFFAYIELGSLGHWGEWHVYYNSNIRELPNEEIRDLYVKHYQQAFPEVHLLMRRPFNIAALDGLGLYNDMTADFPDTTEWLEWIAAGGEYSQTGEPAALSPMPDAWQRAPIGGEETQSMSEEDIYGDNLSQTISLLETSHTTFIGPGGPYDIPRDGPLQDGIDQVLSTIGYRLMVLQVRMPKTVVLSGQITIRFVFSNEGIAPIYYNWPVHVYFMNEEDVITASVPLEMDVRKILPGSSYKAVARIPVEQLENGTYTIGVAILDPLTQQPAIQFAMQNPRPDCIQELGRMKIRKLF